MGRARNAQLRHHCPAVCPLQQTQLCSRCKSVRYCGREVCTTSGRAGGLLLVEDEMGLAGALSKPWQFSARACDPADSAHFPYEYDSSCCACSASRRTGRSISRSAPSWRQRRKRTRRARRRQGTRMRSGCRALFKGIAVRACLVTCRKEGLRPSHICGELHTVQEVANDRCA